MLWTVEHSKSTDSYEGDSDDATDLAATQVVAVGLLCMTGSRSLVFEHVLVKMLVGWCSVQAHKHIVTTLRVTSHA